MSKTYEEVLTLGKQYLKENHILEYDLDAWYLFAYYFKINRASYFLEPKRLVWEEEYKGFMEVIKQRANRVPLQHITGEQEFMGFPFVVSKDVLIPRQDTEILVEEVLKVSGDKDILDLCTGSGCILISLSKLGNINKGLGVDISMEALNIANRNKGILHADNVSFLHSDLFQKVEGKFDIIVSNPPYIKTNEIHNLMDEVKIFEPNLALDGKEDGLFFYKKIIEELPRYLKSMGRIFFEIGYDQGESVSELLYAKGFQDIEVVKDLAGLNRVVKASYVNYEEHFT